MATSQLPMMAAEEDPTSPQQRFLHSLHYVVPATVFAYYVIARIISACTLQNLRVSSTGPRKVLLLLASLVMVSFLIESGMLLTDTAINDARYSSKDSNVSSPHPVNKHRSQGSQVWFADRKLLRFTLCSHCSFGLSLLSVFSLPRIWLCGTHIPVRGSLD